jgi:hypothetical protein
VAPKNPLARIKDLTVDALRSPKETAGKAVGQAREAAAAGRHVAEQVSRSATSTAGRTVGTVTSLVGRHRPGAGATQAQPTPVNVVEELGLDAAPVEEKAAEKPATSIDAAADTRHVEVTPADVAPKVAKKAPPRKAATKAPAKKASSKPSAASVPGAKLPPRRPKPSAAKKTTTGAKTGAAKKASSAKSDQG